jgi:hypothetical protein
VKPGARSIPAPIAMDAVAGPGRERGDRGRRQRQRRGRRRGVLRRDGAPPGRRPGGGGTPGGLAATTAPAGTGPRVIVDAAGRQLALPAVVTRVFAAGAPASIFLHTLAPETLAGWTRALAPGRWCGSAGPPRF